MSLIYKFKKEKLLNGRYATRPRILVVLSGKNTSIEVPALIDRGCDTTVIPESIAKAIGLNMEGEKIRCMLTGNQLMLSKVKQTSHF